MTSSWQQQAAHVAQVTAGSVIWVWGMVVMGRSFKLQASSCKLKPTGFSFFAVASLANPCRSELAREGRQR